MGREWCKGNFLNLNIKKTKEIIDDFRIEKDNVNPVINGAEVDRVESYKYSGTIIDHKLNGIENILRSSKKANQYLCFSLN